MRRSRFVGVLVVSVMMVLAVVAVPALAAEPPTIDGESSGGVTATAASLAALINPNGQETTYKFEYSTEATGETLEGTVESVPGAEPLPEVAEDQTAGVTVESLTPHTQYFYRVVATNASKETTTGVVQSFTTALPPEKPTVEAELVGMTAQLKGVLNPNNAGEEGNYEFVYRQSGSECQGENELLTAQTQAFGAKEEAVTAEAGLEPNATYAFCLLARNLAGETAVSSAATLTTPPEPPAISEETTSALTSTGVTLRGEINPNNQETTYAFEYSTQATGETLEGEVKEAPGSGPLAGFGNQAVETNLEGLLPRTQYFWRIAATNATSEAASGSVVSFTTFDKPTVEAEAAQAVTRTTAAVAGTVNPGGLTTRAHLVYVEEGHYNPGALECPQEVACAYGEGAKTTPNEQIGGPDYSVHAVGPLLLGELKPGKTYHYALIATNSEGTRITPDQTFTTSPATPPSASTGEASNVTQLSATLSGTADTRGLPGTLSFQVALSPEGGSLGAGLDGLGLAVRHERVDHVLVRPVPAAGHDLLLPRVRHQRGRHRGRRMALIHDRDVPVPVRRGPAVDTAAAHTGRRKTGWRRRRETPHERSEALQSAEGVPQGQAEVQAGQV